MDQFVDVPGGRLFVACEGEGPPIVLLHAAIVDHRAWDDMVPGLVAAGFRVVRYDYRGFGQTTTDDVDFSNRADLIAVLVGNSRGGVISFDTAIEYPDRVVAVVGVGASLGGFDGTPTPQELEIFHRAARIMAAPAPDLDEIADLTISLWVDGPGQSPDRVDASIRRTVREMCRPLAEPGRVQGRPIRLEPSAAERLGDLRCPVLAVAGQLDVSDVVQTALHLAEAAPNARAVVWPDVAHMVGLEQPARLNALIVDFLRPLRPW